MPLTQGVTLGPYEILSLLGAGGMGEVYLARDTRLQRTVAIKILPAHLSSNPDLHARFVQEAKSISSLQHPNICVVHDIGSQDGVDYMVMEYVSGQTLDRITPRADCRPMSRPSTPCRLPMHSRAPMRPASFTAISSRPT